MKKLSDHIRFLLLLILTGLGTISCSEEMERVNDDAQVTFTARLNEDIHTRAFGEGQSVDRLVMGIFKLNENGEYSEMAGRHYADIVNGKIENITLSLAKSETYHFVFWAYNSGCGIYDMTDLTAIKMDREQIATYTTFEEVENTDAFFAAHTLTVKADKIKEVKLTRPLAQINVGTSGTAAPSSFTVYNAATVFHPFDGTVSGEVDYLTWEFEEVTDETFSSEEKQYNYLMMCYLFAPVEKAMQKSGELKLNDTKLDFPSVALHANHRNNIVGSFTE